MARGHCPVCFEAGRESLHEIVSTGERRKPDHDWDTTMWWRLVLHSDGQGNLCPGGGEKI